MRFLQIQMPSVPTDSINIPDPAAGLKDLKGMSLDDLLAKLANDVVTFAINLAIAIAVFYIGKLVINKLYRLTENVMTRRKVDKSLITFVLSFVRIVLYFILIVTVISILGIETSSFLAIFASAGIAIGMALSGTLQNFAGGVLILLLKPYKIGDYIEAQGFAGTVTEIQIFNTIISTPDNKSIIIPNGPLSTSSINNWSRESYRRVEWTVGISYGNDVAAARRAILEIIGADHRIVKTTIAAHRTAFEAEEEKKSESAEAGADEAAEETPATAHGRIWRFFHRKQREARERISAEAEIDLRMKTGFEEANLSPAVVVTNLGSSSVDLSVRAWAPTALYWPVYFDINERIYTDLPKAGIDFPFPQLDVHLDKQQ